MNRSFHAQNMMNTVGRNKTALQNNPHNDRVRAEKAKQNMIGVNHFLLNYILSKGKHDSSKMNKLFFSCYFKLTINEKGTL